MITREPLVGAKRKHSEVEGWLRFYRSEPWATWPSSGGEPNQKKTEPPGERSFTELRFASFPLRFCRTAQAVKGQDERLTGALDSLPVRGEMCVHFFDLVCAFFYFFA